ncbi:MAG: peptidase domain-containing ABC transporter [Bacteroides sp.]|nr:peptidase domain-containing ABC transporter [Bacteroides sp.]
MMEITCIRQRDMMQCGAACLTMICRYYRLGYSLDDISEMCPSSTEGVSMLALNRTAEFIGFNVECAKDTISNICESTLPAILHWRQNHFVVLYKIRGNHFYIADPQKGKIKYSYDDFAKYWICSRSQAQDKGIVMYLQPTSMLKNISVGEIKGNEKEKKSFAFLFGYLRQYSRYFIHLFLGMLLACILQLIMPFMTQSIVDLGIKNKDIGFIWMILLGEFMIILGRAATDFIRRWMLMHISMRINISLLSDFFIKLLKLPMSFFDSKLMGDLLQRMNDHGRVQSFLTTDVLSLVFNIISFIIFGIVLCIYDFMVFSIFLIGSIIYGCWIAVFLNRRKIIDYELFDQQSKNQDKTYQLITSIQEIKLQDCERRRRWEWEDAQADLFKIQMKSLKLQQIQEGGALFINEIKNILITVLAATGVINGYLTLGGMLAIQYIVGQLNSPIEQLMHVIYSLQDVKISLERINEIHLNRNEETNENNMTSFSRDKSIIIKNLYFKYDIHAPVYTLDNVSVTIPEGKITAIVGASGSGKTTLIKLMLGYYKVLSGRISIAGRDINHYNLKWWRQQCGVVMQNGIIFSESIARNIAVDDREIDVDRLRNAAKIANIHDYIINLPLKYDTKIGLDGVGLSQGQKQRILIARAVYKNPDFIFLDEATNALDAKNERDIVENLDRFYKGRTVVVVAHRLSTVKNADQIIVLDRGRVVETGNHASLIKNKGVYYNLVKNQLELGN